jgi:rhamnosyltransferase
MTEGGPASTNDPTMQSGRDPRPSANSVAAVIVTYHPDASLADRVRPLIGQVGAILIVDNGSSDSELASVDTLVREGVVGAIRNGRNVGVATALNQGLAWAEERGYSWALTLDQDTEPSPDVVPEAARVLETHGSHRIAVVGAGYHDGRPSRVRPPAAGYEVPAVITAGALHSLGVWQDLGGFRDDFFIDYVDVEFCLRARARGYAVFRSSRSTIRHAIGNPTTHQMGLRTFRPTNHSRRRRYYITRNRIIVWLAYARREPRYVAHDVKASAKELVKLILFEDDRPAKLRSVARGAWDGIRGATGGATHR